MFSCENRSSSSSRLMTFMQPTETTRASGFLCAKCCANRSTECFSYFSSKPHVFTMMTSASEISLVSS